MNLKQEDMLFKCRNNHANSECEHHTESCEIAANLYEEQTSCGINTSGSKLCLLVEQCYVKRHIRAHQSKMSAQILCSDHLAQSRKRLTSSLFGSS